MNVIVTNIKGDETEFNDVKKINTTKDNCVMVLHSDIVRNIVLHVGDLVTIERV